MVELAFTCALKLLRFLGIGDLSKYGSGSLRSPADTNTDGDTDTNTDTSADTNTAVCPPKYGLLQITRMVGVVGRVVVVLAGKVEVV